MAVYEPESDRLVVRVVYDGPGRAGKTTNLEQLARIFGNKPGSALQVHPAASGQTLFFDWFSFDGGLIDGHNLEIQLVTVPGRRSLDHRRAKILQTADVVVLVCDSAPSGLEPARETLESLLEHLGARADEVPFVVQANKQDLPHALLPHEFGAQLDLGGDVPVVGAQASAGIGVRETAIHAIRAAVREMKRRTPGRDLSPIVGRAATADDLRLHLERLEAPAPARPSESHVAEAMSATTSEAAAPPAAAPVEAPAQEVMPEGPADRSDLSAESPAPEAMPERPSEPPPPPEPAASASPVPQDIPVAPIAPRHDVPSGHVWPVPDGRRVLERLAGQPLAPAAPPPDAVDHLFHAAGLCLRTRPQWRYPDADRGCDALRALVRGFARLGELRPRDIAVALAVDTDGTAVLWHVVPQLPSLEAALRAAPTQARTLVRLAAAHASALRIAARDGLVLRLTADAFAMQDGHLVYTATDLDPRSQRPDIAVRLVDAIDRLTLGSTQLDVYADALARELPDALTRADIAVLGLQDGLAAATEGPARARVGEALRRCA